MKNILDKMASRGVEALSDRELLALLTDDEQLAEVVLSAYDGSLARIGDQPEARLRMVGGLGLKRARMLLAAAEFGRRAVASGGSGSDFINTGDDVVRLFRPQLERLSHEGYVYGRGNRKWEYHHHCRVLRVSGLWSLYPAARVDVKPRTLCRESCPLSEPQ